MSTNPPHSFLDGPVKTGLWIAAGEAVLVAISSTTRWTALAIAILILGFYFWKGRLLQNPRFRRIAWIAALSQSVVILAVIIAAIVGWIVLALVGVLAAAALFMLWNDRPTPT
jgi:hypothetical protein